MSDFALIWDARTQTGDMATAANDLVGDDGLETAIILSLFTDRAAEDGDALPGSETDRRGWWGDAVPVVEGDRFGSRLWLLARSKQQTQVLTRAEEYAREALAWLLEDKVADRIDVSAQLVRNGVWGLVVVVYRPKADPVEYRFNYTWAAQEAKG